MNSWILQGMALLALGAAWFGERRHAALSATAACCLVLLGLPLLVIVANPGGYFAWFLS